MHIPAHVEASQHPSFHNRKGVVSQNVLSACSFDMTFLYVLGGWEGSASNARVLHNALTRSDDPLIVPHGKYFIVDAGYAHSPGFLVPYRGVRYHLQEYRPGRAPMNKELFNYRHVQLRNAIERCFSVMKGRFSILKTAAQYPFETQVKIVVACSLLHNFIRQEDETKQDLDDVGIPVGDVESNPTLNEVLTMDERQWLVQVTQWEKEAWIKVHDEIAERMWTDTQMNSEMSDNWVSSTPTPTQSPARSPVLPTRFSPREKTVKSLVEPLLRAAKIKWTRTMDQILFNTLLEQIALGRKVDNGFKREAYHAAAEEVSRRTEILVNWQNVQNRLRYHKREYNDVKDMLAASGFAWDSERMVVTAPDEVWEEYLKTHPRAEKLRGKRIERLDDLATIVGTDHATGCYAQGSRNMVAASSRVQRDLNEAWTDLDDDTDAHIDISEDNLGDSAGNFRASNESHKESENRSFRNTPSRGTECGSSRGGSTTTKRMRTACPCDVLGVSLDGVAEAMQKFRLGKEVNRNTKVLDLLEEVQGLTNPEFIEVGGLLTKDEKLASFFVSLRPERRVDWLKKTLSDFNRNVGGGSA
ncbi:uncharacterized protein LOC131258362 [Magnolia sinica]|uniref:uncharacterized protein LOC131258362 n=1 Tax=Magnolia sinica TaxID=86752 RepID=UPI0026584487|nr:uncharacterized protein LOC131258362 [Magnolia sinica]XP_058115617.1 uncharacterized protein LOC131258362 [Magnolia sinica]XP_058115618.1 uncharacterized protein LOC131258362 [Magnolia sinica]